MGKPAIPISLTRLDRRALEDHIRNTPEQRGHGSTPDDSLSSPGSGHGVPDEQGCEVLEDKAMKVTYDRETDTLTIVFVETPVAESDEDKPGVILDYDAAGNLVSLEMLDASRRVTLPGRIEYQVAPLPI